MGKNDREVEGRRRPVVVGMGLVMSVALLIGSLATTAGAASVDAGFDISGDRVAGSTMSFTDRSTGGLKWVYWTFGDGRSARSANTTHTYGRAGTYEIRYIVCATSTDCDTERRAITVVDPVADPSPTRPDARFTVSGNLVAGSPVTFTDETTGQVAWAYWNFGDGSNSWTQDSATHTFAEPGTYDVRYSVCADSDRCDSQTQSVTITPAGASPGSSTLAAEFSFSSAAPQGPGNFVRVPITFNDRSRGDVHWVYWNFGDGSVSRELTTTHTYTAPGTYEIRYSVCASTDRCDSVTRSIEVGPASGGAPPADGPPADDPPANDPTGEDPGLSVESAVLGSGGQSPREAAVWSPDGSLLAVWGFLDGRIEVWDTDDLTRPTHRLRGHSEGVRALAWSPDSREIASSGLDRAAGAAARQELSIWNLDDPTNPRVLQDRPPFVGAFAATSLAWSPDGSLIHSAAPSRLWDLSGVSGPRGLIHDSTVTFAEWSPDGSRLLTRGQYGEFYVWGSDDWVGKISTIKDPAFLIRSTSWSPDSSQVATLSTDQMARIWNVTDPTNPIVLGRGSGTIEWSPDGNRIASPSETGEFSVWDPLNPDNPLVFRGHVSFVQAVKWSPDGSRLASAGDDGVIRLWDPTDPTSPIELTSFTGRMRAMEWSPDGTRLMTFTLDETRVWTIRGLN